MSDPAVEVAAHQESLTRLTSNTGPIRKDAPTATKAHELWTRNGKPTSARIMVRRAIGDSIRAQYSGALADRQAIVLVGAPASGKSTVLRTMIEPNRSDWIVVDADEIKDLLLEEAVRDGSYNQIVPAEVRALEGDGERFFPREFAALVHAESVVIADWLRQEAIAAGLNLVIDGVLADPIEAEELGAQLAVAGYTINEVQLEICENVSIERMLQRWSKGYVNALAVGGLGGRWVPPSYIGTLYKPGSTQSRCYESSEHLAQVCGAVATFTRYDVPQPINFRLTGKWRRVRPDEPLRRI